MSAARRGAACAAPRGARKLFIGAEYSLLSTRAAAPRGARPARAPPALARHVRARTAEELTRALAISTRT